METCQTPHPLGAPRSIEQAPSAACGPAHFEACAPRPPVCVGFVLFACVVCGGYVVLRLRWLAVVSLPFVCAACGGFVFLRLRWPRWFRFPSLVLVRWFRVLFSVFCGGYSVGQGGEKSAGAKKAGPKRPITLVSERFLDII